MSDGPNGLQEAIEQVLLATLDRVHTCIPGRVEKYDYTTRKAEVKPLLRARVNGLAQSMPVIPSVTVGFPAGGTASLTFPVAKGDLGLLFFSERSVDEWKLNGRENTPADPRTFDLTDAFFLPWFRPFSEGGPADASSLVLKMGAMSLRMSGGKVALGTSSAELLDILDGLFVDLIATNVVTPIGTYPISSALNGQLAMGRALLTLIRGTL